MVKIVAALSILNSSGASPGYTKKAFALVARASCSGASHSSGCLSLTMLSVLSILEILSILQFSPFWRFFQVCHFRQCRQSVTVCHSAELCQSLTFCHYGLYGHGLWLFRAVWPRTRASTVIRSVFLRNG